jgi:hypothetical protein
MYQQDALMLPECASIYLTHVKHEFECDTFMPPVDELVFKLDPVYTKEVVEGDVAYIYQRYARD